MTSQNDCYFFYKGTCTKDKDCPYRHEPRAAGNPVCDQWKAGSCQRNPCHFRHANFELHTQCFYENQPSGCLSSSCTFTHSKPRPLLANLNLVPMNQPRLNVPFQSRFGPHMFGNAFTHGIPSPQKTRHQSSYHRGPRPVMFPNNSGLPFQRPNVFNQTNASFGISNPVSTAQKSLFRLTSLMKDSQESNKSTPQGSRDMQKMSGDMIRANVGDELLPLPGARLPFSIGGLVPNILASPGQVASKQKDRSAGREARKSYYKRTVKKYEGIRNRRNEKQSRRRNERKSLQDEKDEKRKKKEKRSSNKVQKDNSSKDRKVKRDRNASKSKTDGMHLTEEGEEDTYEEVNLGFKVKSLEEILREKALKKFLERQKNAAVVETTQSEAVKTAEVQSINDSDVGVSIIYTTKEVLQSEEQNMSKLTEPKVKKMKHLKPLKPLKPLKKTKRNSLEGENSGNTIEENKNADQKKPLPPLKRLKPLSNTLQEGHLTCKNLKRKLETTSDDIQLVSSNKAQKVETVMVDDSPEDEHMAESKLTLLEDKSVVTNMEFETASKKEITRENVRKLPPRRSIVVHQSVSGTRKKPVGAVSESKVRRLRIEDKMLLLLERAEKEASKDEKVYQEAVSTTERLPKQLVLNGNRKPVGKIIKLNTVLRRSVTGVTSTTTAVLSKDAQPLANSEPSSSSNATLVEDNSMPLARLETSGVNTVDENVNKQMLSSEIDKALEQNQNIETNNRKPSVQLRSGRMIKLNRDRLTDTKTDDENKTGKSQNPFNTLGRKMKVNMAKPKQAVVKPVFVNVQNSENTKVKTSWENCKETEVTDGIQTTLDAAGSFRCLSQNNEVLYEKTSNEDQKRPETAMVKPMATKLQTTGTVTLRRAAQVSRTVATTVGNVVKTVCNVANTDVNISKTVHGNIAKSGSNIAKTDVSTTVKESGLAFITNTSSNFAKIGAGEDDKTRLKIAEDQNVLQPSTGKLAAGQPKAEDVDLSVLSKRITEEESEPETDHNLADGTSRDENHRRKDSLDRLVEEVSEDIKDEGEDFLDEALEKAIAELSPVNTDDEEDVSNADDLLLEIEEMINS